MPLLSILDGLWQEVIDFLSIGDVLKIIQSGDYSSLRTWDGFQKVLYPLIPVLLVVGEDVASIPCYASLGRATQNLNASLCPRN